MHVKIRFSSHDVMKAISEEKLVKIRPSITREHHFSDTKSESLSHDSKREMFNGIDDNTNCCTTTKQDCNLLDFMASCVPVHVVGYKSLRDTKSKKWHRGSGNKCTHGSKYTINPIRADHWIQSFQWNILCPRGLQSITTNPANWILVRMKTCSKAWSCVG